MIENYLGRIFQFFVQIFYKSKKNICRNAERKCIYGKNNAKCIYRKNRKEYINLICQSGKYFLLGGKKATWLCNDVLIKEITTW